MATGGPCSAGRPLAGGAWEVTARPRPQSSVSVSKRGPPPLHRDVTWVSAPSPPGLNSTSTSSGPREPISTLHPSDGEAETSSTRAPVQDTVRRPAPPDQVRVTFPGGAGSGGRGGLSPDVPDAPPDLVADLPAGTVGGVAPGVPCAAVAVGGLAVGPGPVGAGGVALDVLDGEDEGSGAPVTMRVALGSCPLTTWRPTCPMTSQVTPDPTATTPSQSTTPTRSVRAFMQPILPRLSTRVS